MPKSLAKKWQTRGADLMIKTIEQLQAGQA